MSKFKLIIFDIDDVLYSEIDYVKSGFLFIAKSISNDIQIQEKLFSTQMELFKKDQKHVFDNLFKIDSLNSILNVYKKEDLIKLYREHLPSIKLSSKMLSLLNKIKTKNLFLSILSDGRKKSQELKIKSLGLDKIVEKIILTDSLGSQMEFWKPHTYGFKLLLDHFNIESNQSCYIGDNLVKDFVAPNKLGMTSILFKNKNGLYNLENQNTSQCEFIVNSVSELENLIFK